MIEEYSIKQLLSDHTLFVPEIQRDYVWGSNENYQKVLLPFLNALDYNLKDNNPYNIGFLYSYKTPYKENYIIDGQQRFTTIILLLYVLATREDNVFNDFKSLMELDSPTMRFTYNVRPQTEAFMRDLFQSQVTSKDIIVNQTWYLSKYNSDTTIISMVNAVDLMSSELSKLQYITYKKILNQVKFWYFNVDETSQGEELYITMNSRGQKLTNVEQIKPYLFDEWRKTNAKNGDTSNYGKKWDKWEEEFYEKKGDLDISSVDRAMNAFLRIVYEMENQTVCEKDIPIRKKKLDLPLISRYMNSMRNYASHKWPELLTDETKYLQHGVLKALISEGLKKEHYDQDLERIERIFTNILERRKILKSHENLLSFLHAYSESSQDFYSFVIDHPKLCDDVFDEHELSKIKIFKMYESDPNTQKAIELAFQDAETRLVWNGDITPLIEWSLPENGKLESFCFDSFNSYVNKVDAFLGDDKLKSDDMDLTRRALLAFGLHDYPFSKGPGWSFAYDEKDWHKLLLNNIPKFKVFLDKYQSSETINRLINEYAVNNEYSDFVHNPKILEYCKQKNIQWWWGTCFLMKRERWSGEHANIKAYKYYLKLKSEGIKDGWIIDFRYRDETCVYIKQVTEKQRHIAIDLTWNAGNLHNLMKIVLYMEFENEEIPEFERTYLKDIAESLSYEWDGNHYSLIIEMPNEDNMSFLIMDKYLNALFSKISECHI